MDILIVEKIKHEHYVGMSQSDIQHSVCFHTTNRHYKPTEQV